MPARTLQQNQARNWASINYVNNIEGRTEGQLDEALDQNADHCIELVLLLPFPEVHAPTSMNPLEGLPIAGDESADAANDQVKGKD